MKKITEIKLNSTWVAKKEFAIGIGSDSRNPNTTSLYVPEGALLVWDGDAPNGNVWFYVTVDGIKHRGKIESGNIINVIKDGKIELSDLDTGRIPVYNGEYLQKLLNK